jgi:adenine deaminase
MYQKNNFNIEGNIIDIVNKRIFPGRLTVKDGRIDNISEEAVNESQYILPGFIDSHIHIESSMLIPSEFARLAVVHGTVGTVSDPHEIANVLGIPGIRFMIKNGNKVPFKFYFGASSCVPATNFETSGASLGPDKMEELFKMDNIRYMSEMMNYPGVLFNDPVVLEKIRLAKKYNKPIDGHAPGLKGQDAKKYIEAGITTDHECFTIQEALDKIKYGMKILIREGSAAKNFNELIPLIKDYPDMIMFCSDDRHPNDLVKGHINEHVRRAIAKGYDLFKVLRSATLNPVRHYGLDVGLLQPGDDADFIVVDNLKAFHVISTFVKGTKVAEQSKSLIQSVHEEAGNVFRAGVISSEDIRVKPRGKYLKIIQALDRQLITKKVIEAARVENNYVTVNTDKDILKLVVMNRYQKSKPSIAFIRGFGLKKGAIASTIAHDSHNIIAVGTSDQQIADAINLLIREKGGISLTSEEESVVLPLPVAGLMSNKNGFEIASLYENIDKKAKKLGSTLHAPYMTLSFMALLVIPSLKLSDKGLFDNEKFELTSLFQN